MRLFGTAALLAGLLALSVGLLSAAAESSLAPIDGRLGGELSATVRTSKAYSQPGPNLSAEQRAQFNRGDAGFDASFVAGAAPVNSGLGPRFNNASCAA